MTAGARQWKVGELARATGLTVRTLHHWEEVGLVSPQRTVTGHRVYASGDVTRLYQVLALRQTGLGLDEIAALLAGDAPSPRETLRRHLRAVEADLRRRLELRDRLSRVLDALERENNDGADVSLLLEVIGKMTMFEEQLTSDQRDWFTRRRETVGEERWQEGLDAWPQLLGEVRAAMDAGTDPTDPAVQRLISRWDELTGLFIGDNAGIRKAAGKAWQTMWAEHEDKLRRSPRVAPPEMWDYIQRGRQAR
ncbi:MAG: MerR family transcriptional regulator [Nocardiopsaceae bacterium]|nr:MerR family transcriptional regulator [Nocardiopsaceae bacterium]